MDRFIAIAVNQGDAFFLERSDKRILVDGGKAIRGFPSQLRSTIGEPEVDVVVCTHNDADHVNGLIGYFNEKPNCKEVWLPGIWTARLDSLINSPLEFTRELASEIVEGEPSMTLETLGDEIGDIVIQDATLTDGKEIDAVVDAIMDDSCAIERLPNVAPWPWWRGLYRRDLEHFRLWVETVEAADRIRQLAMAAYHSGARIRWFEYSSHGEGEGGESYLKPVNATEMRKLSKRSINAFKYVALSVSNRRSLVFHSPGALSSPDVLFSADSNFSFDERNMPKLSPNSLVTAPHHGSETNSAAYGRIKHSGNLMLVRSDGKFKSRPGPAYLNASAKRFCTLCRNAQSHKQDVRLEWTNDAWGATNGTSECICE